MKEYTVGIGIAPTYSAGVPDQDIKSGYIVLMLKSKPERQAGYLNFPGGKVEPDEPPVSCMRREWREETGVDLPESEWVYVGHMFRPNDFIVHCYLSINELNHECKTQPGEDKIVMIHTTDFLNEYYIDDFSDDTVYENIMPNVDLLFRAVRSPDFFKYPGMTFSIMYPMKNEGEKDYGDVKSE